MIEVRLRMTGLTGQVLTKCRLRTALRMCAMRNRIYLLGWRDTEPSRMSRTHSNHLQEVSEQFGTTYIRKTTDRLLSAWSQSKRDRIWGKSAWTVELPLFVLSPYRVHR